MHVVTTEIEIDATPQQVWAILLDFPSLPEWNPFIRSIKGIAKVGDRLTVSIQPQGAKAMTFRPAGWWHQIRLCGHESGTEVSRRNANYTIAETRITL